MTRDSRTRRISRLATRFERGHAIRLTMLLVVALSATAGFLVSALMLWVGLSYMPVRYALACATGYTLFIALMNRWLGAGARVERGPAHSLVDTGDAIDITDTLLRIPRRSGGSRLSDGLFEGGRSGGGGVSAAFGSQPPPIVVAPPASSHGTSWLPDLDEDGLKLLPLFAITAIGIGLVASVGVVWSAPQLVAELLVDGAIAGETYRRLRRVDWTHGITVRTWKPMLAIFVSFVLLGMAAHYFNPKADSIGDLFR